MWPTRASRVHDCHNQIPPIHTRGVCSAFAKPCGKSICILNPSKSMNTCARITPLDVAEKFWTELTRGDGSEVLNEHLVSWSPFFALDFFPLLTFQPGHTSLWQVTMAPTLPPQPCLPACLPFKHHSYNVSTLHSKHKCNKAMSTRQRFGNSWKQHSKKCK